MFKCRVHHGANGIIVIHEENSICNGWFGRNHIYGFSFGNGSIPQINFRKCIKRNSYSNRQRCTVASVKTLDARSWVSGGKTTIRILTTESLHNSRAETLRPDSCEPGLFLCRRQEDHDARNRNRPPTAQPDRQPEPNRSPAAQPNNRAEPNRNELPQRPLTPLPSERSQPERTTPPSEARPAAQQPQHPQPVPIKVGTTEEVSGRTAETGRETTTVAKVAGLGLNTHGILKFQGTPFF